MKENRNIQIIIRPVENREGEYIAYFENEFLQATFSVLLKDNIFGALALQSYSEMIRKTFAKNYRSGTSLAPLAHKRPSVHAGSFVLIVAPGNRTLPGVDTKQRLPFSKGNGLSAQSPGWPVICMCLRLRSHRTRRGFAIQTGTKKVNGLTMWSALLHAGFCVL